MRYLNTISLTLVFIMSACAYQQVSYERDIAPIINSKCNECHTAPNGYGYRTTGLMTDSYDALMKGSVYGPVIVAGDSRRSILNMLLESRAGSMQRNIHKDKYHLKNEEIEAFRVWVDQGALDN